METLYVIVFMLFCGGLIGMFYLGKNEATKEGDDRIQKMQDELHAHAEKEKERVKKIEATATVLQAKLLRDRSDFEEEKANTRKMLSNEWRKLESDRETFYLLLGEKAQSRPELARRISEAQYYLDLGVADDLLRRPRPALKAADAIKVFAAEKRELMQKNKSLQYQLEFYESIFPWLEEFKEVPIQDAISMASDSEDKEYDAVRNWLSPEEYKKLSDAEKYQRALDKWKQRKKSSWEIGIDFERCVGYQLEARGYAVKYLGATLGLEDMGRDLLATKDGVTLVIQCKRWAKEKTIHEKHICQLYGSVAVLATQNPENTYKGVFITSTVLSETAKRFAEYSGIAYVENCESPEYPMIKCNVAKNGEKIYHLPFDQQYDRAIISAKNGDFYAWTTREAEKRGFRRAYRWHPDKT